MTSRSCRSRRVGAPARTPISMVAGFLVVFLVAPDVQAACTDSVTGGVMLPTGTADPPMRHETGLQGVVSYIATVTAAGKYELAAVSTDVQTCTFGMCSVVPDFNVAWFQDAAPSDVRLRVDAQPGDQAGTVPTDADYGVVYMRYGPDLVSEDGSALEARFTLGFGC